MDAETARHRALLRHAVGTTVADAFKTPAELEAEELLALKAARVKAAAKAQAEQAYAQATREGIAAAVVPIHPVQATPQAAPKQASPAPAQSASDKPSRRKWTPEKLADLEAYRATHTMPETAARFGISEQRIRKLQPSAKPKASPFPVLTHHLK